MERKTEPTAEEKRRWEAAERNRIAGEKKTEGSKKALNEASGTGGERENKKDEKVPVKDDTIFINLSTGTVMLTNDGDFNGRFQEGKMMISSQRVSKVTNGQAKNQYIPFPYSDCARLYQALKEHRDFIMNQVEKERKKMLSVNMDD